MERLYQNILGNHFSQNRQMIFLTGPRQVGKTTVAKMLTTPGAYFNWDNINNRRRIIDGPETIARDAGLDTLSETLPVVTFDEIHTYRRWKTFLKGFFDSWEDMCRIIVTGSSRLDIYKRGGDSLMGRYFLYRMHPLSIAELCNASVPETLIRQPSRLPEDVLEQFFRFGGFPEPFLTANTRFYNRWRRMRDELLLREDIRDLTRVQEIGQIQVLTELLREHAGQLINFSSLAEAVNCSVDSVRRWIVLLESLHFCFIVRPWHTTIRKSIRKHPKIYLWDWSGCISEGGRSENLVAAHLLKAVHFWTDSGFGEFSLHFIRDKMKREVDFLIVKDKKPWILIEVKKSAQSGIAKNIYFFHQQLKTSHAFQLVLDASYVDRDCFTETRPLKVPASTFLSQLV
jgi:hypothetical protein